MSALLKLLQQKKQDMSAGRRSRTVKPTDGSSRWRIMGSWRGEGQQFWHDFGQHFVKDATGKIQAIYMCTDKTFNRPCAVCDAVASGMRGASDETTMKLLQDARSTGRILLNALHLDRVSGDPNQVEILELPPTVFEQFINICAEWEEAGETVLGVSGKDIVINRSGTGKNTKYSVQVAAKTTAVSADAGKNLHNLDEYVAQESSEAQSRALASVNAISGLLPPPAHAAAGLPVAARPAAAITMDEDPYAVATPPVRHAATTTAAVEDAKVVEPSPFEDVPDSVTMRPAVMDAAPAAASTGDDDLDALLNSL